MRWLPWMTSCRESWADMLPNDPVILLSLVNARLRDEYEDLDALCAGLDIEQSRLEQRLAEIGYAYCKEQNQFK